MERSKVKHWEVKQLKAARDPDWLRAHTELGQLRRDYRRERRRVMKRGRMDRFVDQQAQIKQNAWDLVKRVRRSHKYKYNRPPPLSQELENKFVDYWSGLYAKGERIPGNPA